MKKIYLPIVAAMFLASCGGNEKSAEQAAEQPEMQPKEVCMYSYNEESTEVLLVAYKYTDKVGVKGVFDSIMVEGFSDSESPAQVIANAGFTIYTESVNSGDPTRDPKIREYFFGKMENGDQIHGSVKSVSGTETEGKVQFLLTMNGMQQPIEGTYTVVDDKLEVKAEITVDTWNGSTQLGELNKVCEDLHKGSDGKSILWPDVSLFISAKLNKACN